MTVHGLPGYIGLQYNPHQQIPDLQLLSAKGHVSAASSPDKADAESARERQAGPDQESGVWLLAEEDLCLLSGHREATNQLEVITHP